MAVSRGGSPFFRGKEKERGEKLLRLSGINTINNERKKRKVTTAFVKAKVGVGETPERMNVWKLC